MSFARHMYTSNISGVGGGSGLTEPTVVTGPTGTGYWTYTTNSANGIYYNGNVAIGQNTILNNNYVLEVSGNSLFNGSLTGTTGSFQNLNVYGNSNLGSSVTTLINNPLTETWNVLSSAPNGVIQLASSQNGVYLAAITSNTLYVSSNYGSTWRVGMNNPSYPFVSVSVSALGTYIMAITTTYTSYYSINNGTNFQNFNFYASNQSCIVTESGYAFISSGSTIGSFNLNNLTPTILFNTIISNFGSGINTMCLIANYPSNNVIAISNGVVVQTTNLGQSWSSLASPYNTVPNVGRPH